ncbi:OmpA family protein [Nocardiopsis sp. NPDC050513]|uniref:OmpA family protein n=1 Tax=Nocardiopsis sp. NPDC050513 TaxID=3364338 RepID=UPI0037B59A9F
MFTRPPLPPVGAIAVCTALTLTGCWAMGSPGSGGASEQDACGWTDTTLSGAEATAETVVMVDLSASVWTSDTGQIPDYARIVRELALEHFHEDDDRTFTLGLFSGDASGIRLPIRSAPLPRPLDQRQEEQVEELGDCVVAELNAQVEDVPVTPGSDVLAAVAAGANALTGASASTLAVVTDGQSNVGCLDLNRVLTETDTAALAEECGTEWPGALPAGTDLRMVGVTGAGLHVVGDLSGTQTLGELRAFWDRVGERLTGAPGPYAVAAAHDWVQAPERDLPDDPPVIVRGDPDQPLVIDAEALFDTDSAELKPAAESSVATVLEAYGDALDRSAPVTVTGHTDSRGSPGHNDRLSTRRAEAVRDYLRDLGFTDVTAMGRGSGEPICDDRPDGEFDDACGRLNRRVEIRFEQE